MSTLTKPQLDENSSATASMDPGQRQDLLKTIFGRTKKSPFVWALPQNEGSTAHLQIQEIHQQFWAGDNLVLVEKFTDQIDEAIYKLAKTVYLGDVDKDRKQHDSSSNRLLNQILAVELPLWMALNRFGELTNGNALVNQFEQSVGDTLDSDGWPLAEVVKDLGMLIASWSRCYRLLDAVGYEIDPAASNQLNWLVYQIARLKRADGSLMFGRGAEFESNAFRKSIVENWSEFESLPFQIKRSTCQKIRFPSTSSISEWAQAGVMRQGWLKNDNKVAFLFDQRRISMEVDNGRTLISGDCTPRLAVDGKPVALDSEIAVSCFLRFDFGDYVELELEFGEYSIARQMLLLNQDELLMVNDVLHGPAAKIDYQCGYPIDSRNGFVRETENNEFYLRCDDDFTLVLPLFMPEWKTENFNGTLALEDEQIVVGQQINGQGMSTPLVFDLNKNRSTLPRTWRRLTVAEQMKTVGQDVAVAYRVQLGSDQWLFYRTIRPKGNRTFLGQNYADDFLVAKIELDGTIKPLLEVE